MMYERRLSFNPPVIIQYFVYVDYTVCVCTVQYTVGTLLLEKYLKNNIQKAEYQPGLGIRSLGFHVYHSFFGKK